MSNVAALIAMSAEANVQLREGNKRLTQALAEAEAALEEAERALEVFIADEVDYMTRNKLGDPEKQHTVKQARQALSTIRAAKT